jgi:hypothetical protein
MSGRKIYTKVFIQDGIQPWEKLELYLADTLWTCQSFPKAATVMATSSTNKSTVSTADGKHIWQK